MSQKNIELMIHTYDVDRSIFVGQTNAPPKTRTTWNARNAVSHTSDDAPQYSSIQPCVSTKVLLTAMLNNLIRESEEQIETFLRSLKKSGVQ